MVIERLDAVRRRIAAAAERSDRDPAAVTLVAVSKSQPITAIAEAYAAGHRHFGENRAAELAEKATALPDDIRWHFVGTLQSNKVRIVRPHVTLLHSLDRLSLVEAWARSDDTPPPALVQVDLAGETQKHGVGPADLGDLLDQIAAAGIVCRGLMVIPPLPETPQDSRRWFDRLVEVRDRWTPQHPTLTELSMGMTDDLEVAVEAGATLVRVGRAIFGPRNRAEQDDDSVWERGN